MRDYLFRGKRIDNGEWVYWNIYGEFCTSKGRRTRLTRKTPYGEKYYYYIYELKQLIDPETVGQYTGFTDKNGDKIFDSDVVDILTENEEVGIVTYDEGCFYVKADGFSVDFRNNINGNDLLIIGNIHDNPELLKWR